MSKVLITGGAGFIGFHLAKNLISAGYQVSLVDNYLRGVKDSELESLAVDRRISLYELNCLDRISVLKLPKDFSYIFHLAAIIGVEHVEKRPGQVVSENLKLLENLLDLAEEQPRLKRFLFASTSEVYAGTLEHFSLTIPTPESTALAVTDLRRPRTSYMLSKICGEALCNYRSLPITIFRPHNIYGPRMGMAHVVPGQLLKAFQSPANSIIPVPSAQQTRTFCYVDDAVEILRRMMESESCVSRTLNLGNQSPEVTIESLAAICYSVVGKNQTPKPLAGVLGSPQRRCPDMSLTNSLTQFMPSVGLEEGVKRTYDWYLTHVFNTHGVSAR